MTDNTMIAKATMREAIQDAYDAVKPLLDDMHTKIDAVAKRGGGPDQEALLDAANAAHAELNAQFQSGMGLVREQGGAQPQDGGGEKPPPHP